MLTVLLRLVFILYAEERGMLPEDEIYQRNYSLIGLFERLREDDARFHDTMDHRFSAWPQVLTLYRLIYDGGEHGKLRLPARHGRLFDPDAYPFLEGRPLDSRRVIGERIEPPKIADGVVYRVLDKLLILDGERLSYRALDVEQIGSVYEAMMGFELNVARGPSIGLRPDHIVVNLEPLIETKPADRARVLKETAGCDVTGAALEALKAAKDVDEIVAALSKRISRRTPNLIPAGALYLQPTEERRRSGSHYTPRSLTEPIVKTTLRPIFEAMGERPTPEQILDLKVCDPAMGSGAFLVEVCRLLGDKLVQAWNAHGGVPGIPPDEDPQLYARRIVAQRCLYGVDKNPFAVDLAKLSLWLATLARDHPFTFLDHALRCGDSLVGLTREQIACFNWEVGVQIPTVRPVVDAAVKHAEELRNQIQALSASDDTDEKSRLLREAEDALDNVRLIGDLAIAAFFGAVKKKDREQLRSTYETKVRNFITVASGNGSVPKQELHSLIQDALEGEKPVHPFHWDLEFPEVFSRANPGFDSFVGNPPFAGKNSLINSNLDGYLDWLQTLHDGAHGNADLVAHFFRRAFMLLSDDGTMGLVATKTIHQGDTRDTALLWICEQGGIIYSARRYYRWPGKASVIVSVLNISKHNLEVPAELDGKRVAKITAYLFDKGTSAPPKHLINNEARSFVGNYVLGPGFTFDDSNLMAGANSITEMYRLVEKDVRNKQVIFPYINGADVNDHPTHTHYKWVINFGQMSEADARMWPELYELIARKVRPAREAQGREARARYWWRFAETAPALYRAIANKKQVLVRSLTSASFATFTFLPIGMVYDQTLIIFAFEYVFCIRNSRFTVP
jgi:hypothetical protein